MPDRLTGTDEFPVPDLVEVRGEVFLPVEAFERLNVSMLEAGKQVVRQPAQRRGRLAPAEGPAGHGLAATSAWSVTGSGAREGFDPMSQSHAYDALQAWGLPISDQVRVLPEPGEGARRTSRTPASTATRSSPTRSTAS